MGSSLRGSRLYLLLVWFSTIGGGPCGPRPPNAGRRELYSDDDGVPAATGYEPKYCKRRSLQ
eukprot:9336480-Prorocentrum_lima.AAC.1